jgi:hypothetical protein
MIEGEDACEVWESLVGRRVEQSMRYDLRRLTQQTSKDAQKNFL